MCLSDIYGYPPRLDGFLKRCVTLQFETKLPSLAAAGQTADIQHMTEPLLKLSSPAGVASSDPEHGKCHTLPPRGQMWHLTGSLNDKKYDRLALQGLKSSVDWPIVHKTMAKTGEVAAKSCAPPSWLDKSALKKHGDKLVLRPTAGTKYP